MSVPSVIVTTKNAKSKTHDTLSTLLNEYGLANFRATFCNEPKPLPLDWCSLKLLVESEKMILDVNISNALSIKNDLARQSENDKCDQDALSFFVERVEDFISSEWLIIEAILVEIAVSLYSRGSLEVKKFSALIKEWPLLACNKELANKVVLYYHEHPSNLSDQLSCLTLIKGVEQDLREILITTIRHGGRDDELKNILSQFSSLALRWSPNSPWAQLISLLWNHSADLEKCLPADLRLVWEQLQFLGFRPHGPKARISLNNLSAESESAWRRQLKAAIGNNLLLKQATTELVLWFGDIAHDRSIIFAAAEVWGYQLNEAVLLLRDHPDPLVRLRVEALQGLISQAPDAAQLLLQAQAVRLALSTSSNCGAPPRTWIADAEIERLIEAEFEACAKDYGKWIPKTAASGEETHVAMLFEKLSVAFMKINNQLELLASQRKKNERLEFSLQYRIVGKYEEGLPNFDAARFSTDVCLIFEAQESSCLSFTRRASYIQAKRLHGGHEDGKTGSYPIDRLQLDNLALQTHASYLLLIGPCEVAPMPVIPVQLYLDLIARGAASTCIQPDFAASIAKSLASWLVYDVIGLWAGDPRTEVVEKAMGGPGREPYVLAKFTAKKVLVRL